MQLDNQLQSVPKTKVITRSIRDRPVYISTDQTTLIVQYSREPDLKAEATDAFLQNWVQARRFANAMVQCLSQIK